MNRKGKTRTIEWLIFGVLALVVLQYMGVNITGMFGAGAAPEEAAAQAGAFCAIEDTTYTFTEEDKYAAGTARSDAGTTDDAFAIFVDGTRKDGDYASGDSVTLSPGSKVDLYLYDTAEDDALDSTNTFIKSFVVPCTGTLDHTLRSLDIAAPTFQLYDNTYTDSSVDGTAWALDAGVAETGTFRISMQSKKGWSSPDGKVCLVIRANKTEWDDISVSGNGITAIDCKPNEVNGEHNDDKFFSWEMGSFEGPEVREYSITVEPDSDHGAAPMAFNMTLYDQQYFLNKQTGNVELGYEDELDNMVGAAAAQDEYLFS